MFREKLSAPPHIYQMLQIFFVIVPVSEITCQTVYVTIQSHVTHVVSGSSVKCLITYAIYPIAVIVQNLSNQITSVLLKWKSCPMSSRVFYDFECTQNTIDTETKRPVHEVNCCIAMSICDKCPDDGSYDDCSYIQWIRWSTCSWKLCKWAFDHPVNEGAVFIEHNSSNYDPHFILSYLITNGEYPEILVNGGNLLEIIFKQSLYMFIIKSRRMTVNKNRSSMIKTVHVSRFVHGWPKN